MCYRPQNISPSRQNNIFNRIIHARRETLNIIEVLLYSTIPAIYRLRMIMLELRTSKTSTQRQHSLYDGAFAVMRPHNYGTLFHQILTSSKTHSGLVFKAKLSALLKSR